MSESDGKEEAAALESTCQGAQHAEAGSPNDARTSADLFAATLKGEYDDHAPWEAVKTLRRRATPEVLELALEA